MAKVIGYLREDQATRGENQVLKKLSASLPDDFCIYVECPLHDGDMERMPDFIVLTTFGVIVLEVKDWVEIIEADKYHAKIRTRRGRVYKHKNPVNAARDFAHILARKLEVVPQLLREERKLKIPWGYATVLPNLPSSVISQLRKPWGQAQVLGVRDLESHVVTQRLKATVPYTYDLRREDIRCIKGVINPVTLITSGSERPALILDEEQEQIVTEAPHIPAGEPAKPRPKAGEQRTLSLTREPESREVDLEPQPATPGERPPLLEDVMRNFSIRLVRGVAGSGKTLVLTQRARYLAAQHPEWRIGVFTFNTPLTENLRASLKGTPNIKVTNFHRLCSALLRGYVSWSEPCRPDGWVNRNLEQWPIIQEMGPDFISNEIRWIKEVGVESRADYLEAERKGRGRGLLRGGRQRKAIYDMLEAYNAWLAEQQTFDWADVPLLVLQGMDTGQITLQPFDAVLIDEAQDFAPSWIQVMKRLLKPDSGLIFMADDPSQSIYRYYSWREKGIPVTGRTRWLRVPYRNTRQIYQAAYEVIREDEILKRDLEEQLGITLKPDLGSEYLRNGPLPQLREFQSEKEEFGFIRSEIEWLLQEGVDARQMVVLHRRRRGVRKLKKDLRGLDVEAATFHSLKGLEFETVFISQMQYTFPEGIERSEYALSEERRLVYMAMTRARERLYLSYKGHWPAALHSVRQYVDRAFA
jgi:hypothetical protein